MSTVKSAASHSAAPEKTEETRGARARIFETARDLFYRQGLRAGGVETIAKEAGATKMSLYRHFPSKDELTAECLKADREEFNEWWDSVMTPHAGNPRKQLEALFQEFQSKTCGDEDESRGCPLANAAVELADHAHPGWHVVFEHKSDVRERLQQLCREMKARNPKQLGDALMLLMEGAYISRLVFDMRGPVQSVSKAAKVLIEDQLA
ncbi:MAG TPA: TetR/AcrR family transcriptional regulator [Nevskiaceae bacterium]|nr:TetR/AcrR family transcriptional regulator [Nevskiaceae bacterium]